MKKPNLFIVGASKSGTTALYNYLKMHPEIFMSETKEPHFFGFDLPYSKLRFNNNINKYLKLFSQASSEKYVGEASTRYLVSKTAAKEIKKFSPKAKIIVMLRNPVDQMYSIHNQTYLNGTETISDFVRALDAEKERKKHKLKSEMEQLLYRENAKYYKQVKRYLDTFGKTNVHIIIFDEFKKNTKMEYQKVLDFLSINPNIKINFNKITTDKLRNSSKKPRSMFLQKIMHVWTSKPRTMLIIANAIPKSLRVSFYNYLRELNTIYEERDPLPNKLRKKLTKEFEPEIKKLEKLLNINLSKWY